MIEIRELTKEELNQLMIEAPLSETKFLNDLKNERGIEPYEFFKKYGLANKGMVSNGRPVYMSTVIQNKDKYEFWTVVNRNVKEIISLCKFSKRELKNLLDRFKTIYATMQDVNKENLKWVEWLGFKKIEEDNHLITYKLGV